ncbi:methyl-accepting chemotaxis protein [Pseudobacteroides cellulosolvens]|uniref:Methyl-accepting chemotaxis sensory transducer n=1 Tax=Pseudobacteroides cellulosolvens ATCC 35603 = DSM 2933 TaxID=398512 RepID=A0A0L6JII2_9FIRM|nr:methyl-accepting chemotaxis protein [Pseudobacteroides cellulosolvens]KNY25549.1 methyl-accepting chemotaxis sensory transducer [Pseudobacteroides cellulosolvens ATCC 35603 = DSM 2933]
MLSKFNISLRMKLSGSFIILILVSSIAIGFCAINNAKSTIVEAVGKTALNICNSMVISIDIEKINELKTKEDMESSYYKELHDKLLTMKDSVGLKYLYTLRKNENGKYIYVVDGTPYDSENFSQLGDEEDEIDSALRASFEGTAGYLLQYSEEWGNLISAYVPIKDKNGKISTILAADFEAKSVYEAINMVKTRIMIVALLVVLIGILFSSILSHFLVRSIKMLERKAKLAKEGDLTVEIECKNNDEVGRLTQTFNDVIASMGAITKNIRYNTKKILTHTDELSSSASDTSKATEEITKAVNNIAEGTLKQVKSVEEVSKSIDETFSQIEKVIIQADLLSNSSNSAMNDIQQVSGIFKDAMQMVSLVNNTVKNTAEIVQKLGERSKEIESFSEAISHIAKQTNLLALNAAIEAARAGENGRGFAVVSDEVKILAEQSNQASMQINHIINMMQEEIDGAVTYIQKGVVQAQEGVNSVSKVELVLGNMEESSRHAYSGIEGVIKAIQVIEKSSKIVYDRINYLADISKGFSLNSQQVAASTQEQLAVMLDMESHIDGLKLMAFHLEKEVDKFKVN